MRVSVWFLQKAHCSLPFMFILVKKVLVANLLRNNLNWKTINFEILVHKKGVCKLPSN